jgi:hypothetical protein
MALLLERSLGLCQSSALAHEFSSMMQACTEDSRAIALAKSLIGLSPYHPLLYVSNVGLAFASFFAGAIHWAGFES